jgi:EmrB/QacA subfamily drug resistance transporter
MLKRKGRTTSASSTVVMIIICTGVFIASLDQTVIYGALPEIMTTLRLSVTKLDQAAWLVIGYLIGFTFAMPLIGRVSDIYGHSRMFIASLAVFAAGSVMAAMSGSIEWLIAARVIQAVGGGAMVPIAMAIAGDKYTGRNRAVVIGIIGAAVEAGGALGPLYGGAIAQYWDWKWIFLLNVPIGIMISLIVILLLPLKSGAKGKVDYLGGVLLAAGLVFFCIGISQQSGKPNFTVYIISFLLASIICLTIFILRSSRIPEPLIKLSYFKNITFTMTNITNLLVGGALIIAMVNVPLMSDTILGSSPLEGGLKLLRLTVMLPVGAVIGGFICKRAGYRLPTIIGLLFCSVGFFLMSRWNLSIADPQMSIDLAICGFGFGLVIAPLGTASMD